MIQKVPVYERRQDADPVRGPEDQRGGAPPARGVEDALGSLLKDVKNIESEHSKLEEMFNK